MNKELKEQAHKEFDDEFDNLAVLHESGEKLIYVRDKIKLFIDSLIDRTVQMTEERIVGVIEDYFRGLIVIQDPQATKENILSIITNKSDNNTK